MSDYKRLGFGRVDYDATIGNVSFSPLLPSSSLLRFTHKLLSFLSINLINTAKVLYSKHTAAIIWAVNATPQQAGCYLFVESAAFSSLWISLGANTGLNV